MNGDTTRAAAICRVELQAQHTPAAVGDPQSVARPQGREDVAVAGTVVRAAVGGVEEGAVGALPAPAQ
ncbi:hypothetical protein ACFXPS_03165 [Nocardia sp. NPDC059091]|uniref:hypothetical protein n=1 Tax=unclassified Nocardia TaxID=2637762 RepID=UPI00369259F5